MGTGQSLSLPHRMHGPTCTVPLQQQRRRESHSSKPHPTVVDDVTSNRQKRSLSAAFSLLPDPPESGDMDGGWSMGSDLVNINAATEEELMTLPGISRQTARNIVGYRMLIGGFRKVEDLALVSGIGATKLNLIRDELCVGRKAAALASRNSSASSSGIDLSMLDTGSRSSSTLGQGPGGPGGTEGGGAGGGGGGGGGGYRRLSNATKVNINTANIFQLMKVQFLTQNLAENIVTYRDRKGSFRCLDDLLKVKGVKVALFSAIRPYLVLSDEINTGGAVERKHPRTNEPKRNSVNCDDRQVNQNNGNKFHMNENQMDESKMDDYDNQSNHCRMNEKNLSPLRHGVHLSETSNNYPFNNHPSYLSCSQVDSSQSIHSQVNQLQVNRRSSLPMHLLQLPDSHHQVEHQVKRGRRSDPLSSGGGTHRILRFASWNLDKCSLEKAENLGVREVVAMTILENGIDLLAVQDLQSEKALTKLCEELNFVAASLNDSNDQTEDEECASEWLSTSDNSLCLHTKKISEERSLGFIYRGDGVMKLISADMVQCPTTRSDKTTTISVFIAVFEVIATFHLCIVNIQFDSSASEHSMANLSMKEAIDTVKQHLSDTGQEHLPVIFVGFFNTSPDQPALVTLKEAGYHPIFSSKQFTDISSQNPDGTHCSENLWLDSGLIKNRFTGNAGIIRNNLTNPWIPCGWGWGGLVSRHCPIWADISLASSTSGSPSARMIS